jgi:hypothetical protein
VVVCFPLRALRSSPPVVTAASASGCTRALGVGVRACRCIDRCGGALVGASCFTGVKGRPALLNIFPPAPGLLSFYCICCIHTTGSEHYIRTRVQLHFRRGIRNEEKGLFVYYRACRNFICRRLKISRLEGGQDRAQLLMGFVRLQVQGQGGWHVYTCRNDTEMDEPTMHYIALPASASIHRA